MLLTPFGSYCLSSPSIMALCILTTLLLYGLSNSIMHYVYDTAVLMLELNALSISQIHSDSITKIATVSTTIIHLFIGILISTLVLSISKKILHSTYLHKIHALLVINSENLSISS